MQPTLTKDSHVPGSVLGSLHGSSKGSGEEPSELSMGTTPILEEKNLWLTTDEQLPEVRPAGQHWS